MGDTETCIGPHTFDKGDITVELQDDDVGEIRMMFVAYCNEVDSLAMNTYFQKPDEQLQFNESWTTM